MYATIILNTKQAGIGNGLTYRSELGLGLGSLVKVPLRKRLVEGIVVDVFEEKPQADFDIKEIADVLSDQPLLTAKQIETAQWIAEYYVCPLRYAIGLWLPGSSWGKLLPEKVEYVRGVRCEVSDIRLGKKQQELLDYLRGKDWKAWPDVKNETRISRTVLKALVEKELAETEWRTPYHLSPITSHLLQDGINLTKPQTEVLNAIKKDPRPSLLFGVTGSGKTEIYAALIRDTIESGKSAVLLLPEILLTENFIERFQQLVDRDAIAVIHSRLTLAQRRKEWQRCRSGVVRLVIGSRSALFSPLPDCGLIILDEEHEWTYKNEQAPRYHSAKVAERMSGKITNHQSPITKESPNLNTQFPKLVLGSATPSVESWYKAKTGEYQLVELPERYGGAALPSVQVVDLAQVEFGHFYPLSPTLIHAIKQRLDRHEQSVLFLNRRGFATSLICLDCRYRFEDPETKLPYTVHHKGSQSYLLSHHTGKTGNIPEKCPKCQSAKLREVGAGTQRIESLLTELFPGARILRADADTLKKPEQMRLLLKKMKEGKADILMGTQSVVKGLDLPNVTLAAVILADIGLSLPHFRAGERVFQLLSQLTGRSGRHQPGEVIIQTFRPRTHEVELAARHDVRSFLEQELSDRQHVHYPPDTELVRIVFSGASAEKQSHEFVQKLSYNLLPTTYHLSRSPSIFSGNKIWQVMIRGKNVRETLKNLPKFDGVIDVDPVGCL